MVFYSAYLLYTLISLTLFSVALYGWLPFLLHGLAKRRKGEVGKGFLVTAYVWMSVLGAWVLWALVEAATTSDTVAGGVGFLMIFAPLLLTGWVPLLIWGAIRWRRKNGHGKWMTLAGGVWALCVVSISVYAFMSLRNTFLNRGDYTIQPFLPEAHTGEVATVEFPYDYKGAGTLMLYPASGTPYAWTVPVQETNRVLVPSGEYRQVILDTYFGEGDDRVELTCDLHRDYTTFTLPQDEATVYRGGFPLTASIKATSRSGNKISLDFALLDSGGNKITLSAQKSGRPKISFEALTFWGKHLWTGDFEYG